MPDRLGWLARPGWLDRLGTADCLLWLARLEQQDGLGRLDPRGRQDGVEWVGLGASARTVGSE